jgi:type IV pilus assembly protein PilM
MATALAVLKVPWRPTDEFTGIKQPPDAYMIAMKKSKGLTGLDLEAGSIAAAKVDVNGSARVSASAILPLGPGVFREGEIADVGALSDALKELFSRDGLSPSVRIGVANQRVAVRTLRLPVIERDEELDTAVRFQAQDHIPLPLDQAVMQHRVIRYTQNENGEPQMDVVVVAARRDMISALLEAARKAGLRPAGIDLSAFGMIRALRGLPELQPQPVIAPAADGVADADAGASRLGVSIDEEPVRLFCNLGDVTNLAVARGAACEFTRIAGFGVEGIAQRLAEKRGLTLEHARQWLGHVGLEQPVETIEGDPEIVAGTREVLGEGAAKLTDELRLSLEFYSAQGGAGSIESVVACGPGTTIPGLIDRLQRELGLRFDVGRPAALAGLDEASAARLTLPYGLALEE